MEHFRNELVTTQSFNAVLDPRADNPLRGGGCSLAGFKPHSRGSGSTALSRFGIWHNEQVVP